MDLNNFLHYKAVRSIVELGKQLLIIIDELFKRSENAKALFFNTIDSLSINESEKQLLKNAYLQSETINQTNKEIIRKRVLDFGGDLVRSLDAEFSKFISNKR